MYMAHVCFMSVVGHIDHFRDQCRFSFCFKTINAHEVSCFTLWHTIILSTSLDTTLCFTLYHNNKEQEEKIYAIYTGVYWTV